MLSSIIQPIAKSLQGLIWLVVLTSLAQIAAATSTVRTNVNEVSDFFAKEIAEQESLKEFLNNSKEQATEAMKSKSALSELQISEGDATNKAAELNNIHVNDLEHQGRLERGKEENSYLNSLEIDYSSPLIAEHKKDSELIADASSKLLTRLVEGLKEFGIDCQQGRGNSQQEAEYHIEINKQPAKDTIYNKVTCEELIARTYQCHDGLSVRCLQQGQRYGNWQDRAMFINQTDLGWPNWASWGRQQRKFRRYGRGSWSDTGYLVIREEDPNVQTLLRQLIIGRLGVSDNSIGDHITSSYHDVLGMFGSIVPEVEKLHYKYREIFNVCEQWQEEWEEQCLVK